MRNVHARKFILANAHTTPYRKKKAMIHVISPYKSTGVVARRISLRWLLRGALALGLFGLALLLFPLSAEAAAFHEEYVSSNPAANAVLKTAPATVTVHFSEAVVPASSALQIYDIDGKLVTTAVAQVAPGDLKTLSVPMTADTSELYVVVWRTASAVEGHHDSGSFRFFVNPDPMLAGMIHAGMTNAGNGSSMAGMSSSSASSSSSTGIPPWAAALAGLVGILLGVVGALVFARRPASTARRA